MASKGVAEAITRSLGGRKAGPQWITRCVCHDDTTPSLALRDGEHGRLLAHCFAGCDTRDILLELRHRGLLEDNGSHRDRAPLPRPSMAASKDGCQSEEFALQIFGEAVEPRRGPVEAYLIARGLGRLPNEVEDIRFHPRCPRGGERLPAMVSLMRDAVTNRPTGVHRTYLRVDGSAKADITPAKMMLGRAVGSVVKLTPDEEVTAGLGLSEGIEDGVAIVNSGWRPVWACLSAGGMDSFPTLHGVEALTLFADADAPGRKAARACATRWRAAGNAVIVVEPLRSKDFAAMAEMARHG